MPTPLWTPPINWDPTKAISAARLNQFIGDDGVNPGNLPYLFTRKQSWPGRNNAGDYTTTSTTYTPIDNTNLTQTVTLAGSSIMLFLGCAGAFVNTNDWAEIDFQMDGTGQNQTYVFGIAGTSTGLAIAHFAMITGIAAGSHTYRPVWKVHQAINAATIKSNAADQLVRFGYWEIG